MPNLYKPNYIIPKNLKKISFPTPNLEIKNILKSISFLPRIYNDKIIFLSKNNQFLINSPIKLIIENLKNNFSLKLDNDNNVIKNILISRTKILLIDTDFGKKQFIIRFPLDNFAIKRLKKQQEILAFFNTKKISFLPHQIIIDKPFHFQFFVEEKLPGFEINQIIKKRKKINIQPFYQSIYPKIQLIHKIPGTHFTMDEKSFNHYIKPKLAEIKTLMPDNKEIIEFLKKLEDYLFYNFSDKIFLTSICHGDLKLQNCLFDANGQLTGIIDWDMSDMDEITLVDISSLLANAIRTQYYLKYSLKKFLLNLKSIPEEFLPFYKNYFDETQTSFISPKAAIIFYWVDRIYKMIKYNSNSDFNWAKREVLPVVKRIELLITNQIKL